MDEGALPSLNATGGPPRPIEERAWVKTLPAILVIVVLLVPLLLAWWPDDSGRIDRADGMPSVAWATLGASLVVAVTASILAVLVGGTLAALFELTDFPGRNFWATVALVPFVCPSLVWALGQIYCYGAGGVMERWVGGPWRAVQAGSDSRHYLACVLVLAEIHAPLAMLILARGFGRLHHVGFEAARLMLPPAARIRWLAGAVRQEAAAAFLLSTALCLGNFGVPQMLQCPLYTIEVYERMSNYQDHAGAMWIALPLLCIAVLAAAGVAVAERGRRYVTARPSHPTVPVGLGRKVWPVGGLLMVYLGLTSFLPVGAMVYECQSPEYLLGVIVDAAEETENTLRIGALAAVLACLAGLLVGSWVGARRRLAIDALAILPLGVPAMLLAVAYARFYYRAWPVDLSVLGGTSLLVILGLATRGWPFVTRLVADGRRRIAPEWEEAARLGQMRGPGRWRWVTGPLLVGHLAAGAVLAYILAVGDVVISQMLCPPGSGTLALRLFTYLHTGEPPLVAGLALLQLTVSVVPLLMYFLLTDRRLQIV